jgi:hypothetical protein
LFITCTLFLRAFEKGENYDFFKDLANLGIQISLINAISWSYPNLAAIGTILLVASPIASMLYSLIK